MVHRIRPYRFGLRFEHEPAGGDPDPAGGTAAPTAEELDQRSADLDQREAEYKRRVAAANDVLPHVQNDPVLNEYIRRKMAKENPTLEMPRREVPPAPGPQVDILGGIRERAIRAGGDKATVESLTDEFGGLLNNVIENLNKKRTQELAALTQKWDSNLSGRLGPLEANSALDTFLAGRDDLVKDIAPVDLQPSRHELLEYAKENFTKIPTTTEEWRTLTLAWIAPKLAEGGVNGVAAKQELGRRMGTGVPPGQTGGTRPNMPESRVREKGERKVWEKELGHAAKRNGIEGYDALNEILRNELLYKSH